ncbi:MAG TPA: TIGR03435 family protein [Bryobacteraceae bacterium]|nr:TIGR03435 family protein [Bryobacteraceae bacterium]
MDLQTYHRGLFEKRVLSVYALVKGKGEPKLKKADPSFAPNVVTLVQRRLRFPNCPLSRLVFLLTRRMDRPALDLTGLPGNFDYMVDLSGLGYRNDSSGYEGEGPSVLRAIHDDLGLQLEPGKHAVDVLVIDSVDKVPSRN